MAVYEIRIKKDAEKDFLALPRADLQKVTKKIQKLSDTPRPPGCEKLKGEEGYRIRQGNYRIVYLINDSERLVTVIKVGHRREVYR